MQHLDFIVWMCAFPVACAAEEAIRSRWCERRQYSDDVRGWAALFMMLLYLGIGRALW